MPHARPSGPRTTKRPSRSTTLLYSGYALSAWPPRVTKSMHPAPFGIRQVAVGAGGAHLGEQLVGAEAAADARPSPRAGPAGRAAAPPAGATRWRPASSASRAAATSTSSRALVGTQVSRLTAPGWWPLRPARWIRRPTALGLPTWSTRSTGVKSTPRSRVEVQTTQRSRPSRSPVLDPLAGVAIERAVVQRDDARPVGARREQRLIPDLGGGAGVGEDERGLALLDRRDDLGQQPQADLPGPGEPLHRLGDERVDLELLGHQPPDDPARPRPAFAGSRPSSVSRAMSRLPSVAERPQRAELGPPAAQPGEGELGLHSALRRHQLVPLVDHDQLEMVEQRRRRRRG